MLVVSNLFLHNYSIIIDWCRVYTACLQTWHVWGFGGAIFKATEQVPFTLRSWVRFTLTLLWKESVNGNALPKSSVFTGYPGFLPHVDRLGSDMPQTGPVHRSCATCACTRWSNMSHQVTARGALWKPSTRSAWSPSFVMRLTVALSFV